MLHVVRRRRARALLHVPCSAGAETAGPPVGGLGRVFVEFGSVEAAEDCARAMDGRFFDGRRVGAFYQC